MYKRDYQMIADVLAHNLDHCEDAMEISLIEDIARGLADTFSDDNIRFNRRRFYNAIGLTDDGSAP